MTRTIATTNFRVQNGALLAYITHKIPGINLRKLLKLVYLIDEHFTRHRGFPLTWFDYFAWEKGPVAPELYAVKENNSVFTEFITCHKDEAGKRIITPTHFEQTMLNTFSLKELAHISTVLKQYGHLTADQLSDITHEPDTLWSKATKDLQFEDGRSNIPIHLQDLIQDNEELSSVYQDAYEWAAF